MVLVPLVVLVAGTGLIAAPRRASAEPPAARCSADGWCSVYRLPAEPSQGWLGAIWGTGPNDVFVVGWGTIVHFDGTTWTRQPNHSDSGIFAVGGTGPTEVFAVGSNRTIQRWNGKEWLLEHRDRRAGLRAGSLQRLLVVGPGEVYACDSQVWKRREDGTWHPVKGAPRERFECDRRPTTRPAPPACKRAAYATFSPDDRDHSLCGGTLSVFDGAAWVVLPELPRSRRTVDAVWVGSPRDVLVSRERGSLLRYDGSSWTKEQLPEDVWIQRFWSDGTWVYGVDHNQIVRRRR
jgi:hypothetical protein